jgi:hypothetical protein
MHDLVIRGGTIVDGTGRERFSGDVAVDDGRIAAVGPVSELGRREIDATGHLVTPGWVDVHTHYDGQVTWDPILAPSSWHGVTTLVMGNCGVGFAPVRPGHESFLIELMEGVEDIPGSLTVRAAFLAGLLFAALALACGTAEERAETARAEIREAIEHGDRSGALEAIGELRGGLEGKQAERLRKSLSHGKTGDRTLDCSHSARLRG